MSPISQPATNALSPMRAPKGKSLRSADTPARSCAWPGRITKRARQPRASTAATILLVRPPRKRPIPWRQAPLRAGRLLVGLDDGAAGKHVFERSNSSDNSLFIRRGPIWCTWIVCGRPPLTAKSHPKPSFLPSAVSHGLVKLPPGSVCSRSIRDVALALTTQVRTDAPVHVAQPTLTCTSRGHLVHAHSLGFLGYGSESIVVASSPTPLNSFPGPEATAGRPGLRT